MGGLGNFPNESLVLVLGAGDLSKVLVAHLKGLFVKVFPYFLIEKALCKRISLLCKGNGASLLKRVLANKEVLFMEKAICKGISLWRRLFAKLCLYGKGSLQSDFLMEKGPL